MSTKDLDSCPPYSSDLGSDDDSVICDRDEDSILDEGDNASFMHLSEETEVKCIVCDLRPPHPGYPTCGFRCANTLRNQRENVPASDSLLTKMVNLNVGAQATSTSASSSSSLCIVCNKRPKHTRYPTCGLVCSAKLQNMAALCNTPSPKGKKRDPRNRQTGPSGSSSTTAATVVPPAPLINPCTICKKKEAYVDQLTCSPTCVEKLANGGGDATMCEYCHVRPKNGNYPHCGTTCAGKAKTSCLYCRCRQRNGRYHLCGNICRALSMKKTPLLLEAPRGHSTFDMVEEKFKKAWRSGSSVCPEIKRVFKIIENNEFLKPYNAYRTLKKNERFRYHGTKRVCSLGSNGNKDICRSKACSVCNILKTSFKVSLASPGGAFGAGIYTSSASNKAFSYCGGTGGAMLLTKVVLGKVRIVNAWNEVMSCPPGYDSVVFDRQSGTLNETIVYSDDAIRPVFLITF